MKTLLKIVLALAAVAGLGFLMVRSAQSSLGEPFTIPRQDLAGWTLTLTPMGDQLDALLSLVPPQGLMRPLNRDLFARMGETLHYPQAGMPVVLRGEFEAAMAGTLTPEALLEAARGAGLESAAFQPRCMARRRISEPGSNRGIFFLAFDLPEFTRFRETMAQRVATGGAPRFDPAALSPILIVAGLDARFTRWLPLRVNPDDDCFAPVIVG